MALVGTMEQHAVLADEAGGPGFSVIRRLVEECRHRLRHTVYGNDEAITLLFVCLAAKGHMLLEGLPGVGKTTLAKSFASVTGLEFRRIQLTPDLMPTDITGHSYFDQRSHEFRIRRGPVFTNLLLADELNRTPPRTQAALLEVMQEQQVTIDGVGMPVPEPFMVMATRNPIEVEGVYILPEAELDRFMLSCRIRYPERPVERDLLLGRTQRSAALPSPISSVAEVLQRCVRHVRVHPDLYDYLLDLVRQTREHEHLDLGASPRASEQLLKAAQAHAAIDGRSYVVPDDVRDLLYPVLRHRLILGPEAEMTGVTVEEVLDQIVGSVPVPVAE